MRLPRTLPAAGRRLRLVEVLEFLGRVGLDVLLVYLTLAGFAALLRMREVQAALVVFGILLGLLWWLWSLIPE
jgi:hypothetical protein